MNMCRGEPILKAELATTGNFPPLILNEWFFLLFCFVGNLSWNFFPQCPESEIFLLLSLISIPEVWKEIKISETEGYYYFFSFFTLKMFQLGISGRPAGFPGSAPGSFGKASCEAPGWQERIHLDKTHLLSPLKPCDAPSPLLPPLLCPSPFLWFPRAHLGNPWEGCFGENLLFLGISTRAASTWCESRHRDMRALSPGGREGPLSLLQKIWVVL